MYYYKAHNLLYTCWKFGKHQSRNSGENNANVRIFYLYVHQPTPCKSAKISEVTGSIGSKVHEIFIRLRRIIGGNNATIHVAIVPTHNSCRMPLKRMKTGCVNFRQHAPQIGYRSKVPWASRRNQNLLLWSRLISVYFLKVLRRWIQALWWKHRKRAYFGHECTHQCTHTND